MPESSRRLTPALSRALGLARDTLTGVPAGLMTDIDGTLSPIVAEPDQARLVDGAGPALRALAGRLAVVAVITGRAAADARRLTGVPELLVAGNHGTEWLEPNASGSTRPPAAADAERSLAAIVARLPDLAGVAVEDKGLSATVHYRAAADPDLARAAILAAIGDPGGSVEVRGGRMSLELRPVGLGDKGAAARSIAERYGLRGIVVMGDDVTDLDMFRAIASLRSSGALRAAIIGVGGDDGEVPPEVAAEADAMVATPAEAASLLQALAAVNGPTD